MCTCIAHKRFFGRTLDVDRDYRPQIVLAPERFPLYFRKKGILKQHHAILGTARVEDGYPLFFDAFNSCGLAMAGLNFPESCRYFPLLPGKDNIAAYELIPWLLGQCCSVAEAMAFLRRLSLWDAPFSPTLPPAPLHWLLSDGSRTVAIESTEEGLQIYDDTAGVLTNEPPFPRHGEAALTGGFDSQSRFQRAAYCRANGICRTAAEFFRLLAPVTVPEGCGPLTTVLSTCCDRKTGKYHALTNHALSPVTVTMAGREGAELIRKELP